MSALWLTLRELVNDCIEHLGLCLVGPFARNAATFFSSRAGFERVRRVGRIRVMCAAS